MGHLTFADLIARRVPLAASEAAALTLAVARLLDSTRTSGHRVRLPDDEWLLLDSSGDVSMVEVHGTLECDETAALSALLRRLLRLDERLPAGGRERVPGGLLIVLARNLGYIHLPATGPDAFRAALERFASPDPSALSAVFWRAASGGRDAQVTRSGARRAADARERADRRLNGASRAELRRALRDLERELCEHRARVGGSSTRSPDRRPAYRAGIALASLAAGLAGALAVAAALTGGSANGTSPATTRADVVLDAQPSLRLVPAVAAGPSLFDAPAPPAPRRDAGSERAEAGRATPSKAAPTQRASRTTRRAGASGAARQTPPKPRDPLAVHRGGTRGIPFTLPRR